MEKLQFAQRITSYVILAILSLFAIVGCVLVLSGCGGSDEPDLAAFGESCAADSDCATNECLLELGGDPTLVFEGGMCTSTCSFEDLDSCSEDEICLRWNPTNEFFCFKLCATDSDCRVEDNYECIDIFPVSVCVPAV